MSENQIIVYQPNETVHLDVRVENETVWLTQHQMAILFGCNTDNIGLHLKNVYAVGELSRDATTEILGRSHSVATKVLFFCTVIAGKKSLPHYFTNKSGTSYRVGYE